MKLSLLNRFLSLQIKIVSHQKKENKMANIVRKPNGTYLIRISAGKDDRGKPVTVSRSVRWTLNGKVDGDCLLIQDGVLTIPTKKRQKMKVFRKVFLIFLQKNDQHKCQPFTIPTFQALNVRFSVKIFAKNLSLQPFGSSKVVQLTTERSLLEARKHSQISKQNKDYLLNRMVVLIFTPHCFSHLRRSQYSTI